MHSGGYEVRRPFAGELDDELAEIRLDDFHTRPLQRGIEMNLLRRHRLGFDDALRAGLASDLHHDSSRVLRGRGPVDLAAAPDNRGFELFEIAIEMSERVLLHALGVVAQPVAVA